MPKLVAIGDSLSQGFQSFAISDGSSSVPALIADAMGLSPAEFALPDFDHLGGLPCNLEWLARRLEERYGADLEGFEWATAAVDVARLLDGIEDYWETGPGAAPIAHRDYHNLAIWGFEVADAYNITAAMSRQLVKSAARIDALPIPSEARMRTASRVLNPSQSGVYSARTQVETARALGADEPIEHLVVWLGANNCLASIVTLELDETGPTPPGPRSGCTLWSADAFRAEYETLARHIARIRADNVYLGTVPHLTIPPITRGVMADRGRLPADQKYYDYYTRFWIHDTHFDPEHDPHLTRDDARRIDTRIDAYNAIIAETAQQFGWHLVDVCGLVDDLAVRRNHGRPKHDMPEPIADLTVRLFEIHPDGRIKRGGLFSLDGVHPTRCGYGLIAQRFVDAIKTTGAEIDDIDFATVRQQDPLVSNPPRTLDDMHLLLATLESHFHLSRWLLPDAIRKAVF